MVEEGRADGRRLPASEEGRKLDGNGGRTARPADGVGSREEMRKERKWDDTGFEEETGEVKALVWF